MSPRREKDWFSFESGSSQSILRMRSSTIQENLEVKLLLFKIKTRQSRCFGPCRLYEERHPGADPEPTEEISQVAWECLGFPQEELELVALDREVWTDILNLSPP